MLINNNETTSSRTTASTRYRVHEDVSWRPGYWTAAIAKLGRCACSPYWFLIEYKGCVHCPQPKRSIREAGGPAGTSVPSHPSGSRASTWWISVGC